MIRKRDAEPVWDEWSKWLAEQRPNVLPKSLLGGAIGYASNNWDPLRRYLVQGFLALDNNLGERTLRAIALGRNNWGVIGSAVGGQTAAVLYSVVGACKHLAIRSRTCGTHCRGCSRCARSPRPSNCWTGSRIAGW